MSIRQSIFQGNFSLQGQLQAPKEFTNGGVIVAQGDKMRGVQPDIFMRTYKLSDGRSITSVAQALRTQCD